MARPLRIEFPGAVYHVTSRGNARLPIFNHFNDKKLYILNRRIQKELGIKNPLQWPDRLTPGPDPYQI